MVVLHLPTSGIITPRRKLTGYTPGELFFRIPKLKWETSTTLNLAVDFGFFNNRLSGTVEWYNTRTKDLLIDRFISSGYRIFYHQGQYRRDSEQRS